MQKLNWLFKMAWRDSRRNRRRMLLFMLSITAGIAALVAINSFGENLQNDIDREARTLLGADLLIETTEVVDSSTTAFLESLGDTITRSTQFVSMASFPGKDGTKLVQIKAVDGPFPFYGKLNTEPPSAVENYLKGPNALVEEVIMIQYGLVLGDSISIGGFTFKILGTLTSSPGRAAIASAVAPRVWFSSKYLEQTGLLQKGSRVEYSYYYKYDDEEKADEILKENEDALSLKRLDATTVKDRKQALSNAFGSLNRFLNLIAFIALLLGCIGVASAIHLYIRDKIGSVAVLRCLGVKSHQAFYIFLIQVVALGAIGAVVGAFLGSIVQQILPMILEDFLPLENVSRSLSWLSIGQGILIGLIMAVCFALLPLISIRKVSPLRTLRADFSNDLEKFDPLYWFIVGLILGVVLLFSWLQAGSFLEAVVFTAGLSIAFLLLLLISKLAIFSIRKFFPDKWPFIWRQGLSNLERPQNQTLTLLASIGLGTAIISTLILTQDLLLNQIAFSDRENQPNMILFDIQSSQVEGMAGVLEQEDLPIIQNVPIVTMRLQSLRELTKADVIEDSTIDISRRVFDREYRITYRDTLALMEEKLEGEWPVKYESGGLVPISLEEGFAKRIKAVLGDKITFNVQGVPIETEIKAIRKVNFNRIQTNFFIVFPNGVLERAPQFHVMVTKTKNPEQSAKLQQKLVKDYPNVSIIALEGVLKALDELITKISFVIRFLAFFSILTGLIVLIGSVYISKYQRMKEAVLLRTLGASKSQILKITAVEYGFLGGLAAFSGILLSVIMTWLLARFSFNVPFAPNLWPLIVILIIIVLLTIAIGLFNSREIAQKPPLEVLRTS